MFCLFKPRSAPAGGSDLRPLKLDELLHNPTSSSHGGTLDSLTEFYNVFATGKAPTAPTQRIADASQAPIDKKAIVPCPIAIGEAL